MSWTRPSLARVTHQSQPPRCGLGSLASLYKRILLPPGITHTHHYQTNITRERVKETYTHTQERTLNAHGPNALKTIQTHQQCNRYLKQITKQKASCANAFPLVSAIVNKRSVCRHFLLACDVWDDGWPGAYHHHCESVKSLLDYFCVFFLFWFGIFRKSIETLLKHNRYWNLKPYTQTSIPSSVSVLGKWRKQKQKKKRKKKKNRKKDLKCWKNNALWMKILMWFFVIVIVTTKNKSETELVWGGSKKGEENHKINYR